MTVSPLQGITHACFGLSYLSAFLLEVAGLVRPRAVWRSLALGFGVAGLVAHTLYITFNQPTPAAPYGSLLLLAWVLALFYLYGTVHYSNFGPAARRAPGGPRARAGTVWAVFVLPVVIGLVGLSLALAALGGTAPPVDVPAWATGERFWGAVHGTLILLASVGISVGFTASLMYLVQARRMRNKVSPGRGVPLLSLERLDTMNRRAVNITFPLLTVGLLVGTLLLFQSPDPSGSLRSVKVVSTAGLWVVFAVLLYMRYAAHVPPRRLAALSIAAFALLLVALGAAHPFAAGDAR